MLHSHLPYYRKAGMWPFGEESFYECMAETYIPLLNAITDLLNEGIKAKITLGITPILAEQMADSHLLAGFEHFVQARLDAAMQDEQRYGQRGQTPDPNRYQLAKFYRVFFQQTLQDFRQRWQRDILSGFRQLQDQGAIEITTSAATHCFSPLLSSDSSLKSQYQLGVDSYKRHFGRAPQGIWLPECAYRPAQDGRPGIEKWLYEAGIKYFFTESFVIAGGKNAELRRDFGPYGKVEQLPVKGRPETGRDTFCAYWLKNYPVAVLGRHEQAGFQVWSAEHGYPGDGHYREFHKKDDRSGLHFWKLTSKDTDLGDKELYNPEAALSRVKDNSDHYAGLIQQILTDHLRRTGQPGLVMVSFDTELFGHWWFEGITWIKEVIRKLHNYTAVTTCTASEYLESEPPQQAIELPESSWGAGGHWEVWLNEETQWMWPIIHRCEQTMEKLTQKYQPQPGVLANRALKQAARELLLLESSDWPFLVTTGQAKQYAIERFQGHQFRFEQLASMLQSGNFDEKTIAEFEDIDNCFPDVNPEYFLPPSLSESREVVHHI